MVGRDTVTLVVDPESRQPRPASFTVQAYLVGTRTFQIELYDEVEETGQFRHLYTSSGQLTVEAPAAREAPTPVLPTLDVRLAPQPDFVLQVQALEEASTIHLIYRLSSRLPGLMLQEEEVGRVTLSSDDWARLQSAVNTTVADAAYLAPADADLRLRSLGRWLFDVLFPAETAAALRDAYWQAVDRLTTWLILEDGVVWLPWELIAPYRPQERKAHTFFLGERHQIGRWLPGLGLPLYSEVPVGEVALAQYRHQTPEDAIHDWTVEGCRALLQATTFYGIRGPLVAHSPYYNLHLLRHYDGRERRDIVRRGHGRNGDGPDNEVVSSRPNLRDRRPVVTMSLVGTMAPTGDWLLPDRILPFLRAGASVVAGPWWPTGEVADRLFWSRFYEYFLVRRQPVGAAVQRARLALRDLLPHSPDWLAYTLFADPRAHPYVPDASQGYTAVQCLDVADPDAPLRPGRTYTFQATIQQRPPEWYKGRLVEPEALPDELSVLFMAPHLQQDVPRPIPMVPAGRGMKKAATQFTIETPGTYPMMVQFRVGNEHLNTLQILLEVEEAD